MNNVLELPAQTNAITSAMIVLSKDFVSATADIKGELGKLGPCSSHEDGEKMLISLNPNNKDLSLNTITGALKTGLEDRVAELKTHDPDANGRIKICVNPPANG